MNDHVCPLKNAQCHGTCKFRKTFSRSSDTRQDVQNAGNCRAANFPIQAWHTLRIVGPGSRQQAGQTLCIVTGPSVQNNERWIHFCAKDVERIDHPRRASLELSIAPEPPSEDKKGEDHSSARDVKRARGEPEQDLSGEIPVPSANETLTPPEIPVAPSGSTSSRSISVPIFPGASSSSGVKRTDREYRAAEFSWCLFRKRCETCTWWKYCD